MLVEGILCVDCRHELLGQQGPDQIDIVKCIKKRLSSPDRAATDQLVTGVFG